MKADLSDPEDYRLTETGISLSLIKKSHAITNPTRHFHSWWEILYIVSGERTFFHANRTLHIKAGTFLCIAPGVLHRAVNPADEVCSLYNVYFGDGGVATARDDYHMQFMLPILEELDPCTPLSLANQETVTSLFERMGHELLHPGALTSQLVWSLLAEMLVCVKRQERDDALSVQNTLDMNGPLGPVIDYLNGHYRENISLESVASLFSITPAHLSRSFKKATRFGFVEYINSLRISECCRLLRNTDKSVLEIAMSCGFGSVTQFGRCFKNLTGFSPREYRQER